MSYITREDGTHFVIPSYRDTLLGKNLKKDLQMLSKSYGEFVTLQKKNATQFEVALSPDTGYLLGESVWQHFKKPMDMVYCEATSNANEAILVIVKDGTVYLDGSFPIESIADELVIFLTQKNNFEIYIYGDVPISQTPTEGKFSFEATSVKSFNVLSEPAFPQIALLKIYELQPIEAVLKLHGIGALPIKQIMIMILAVSLGYVLYVTVIKSPPPPPSTEQQANPYQGYYDALTSPAPADEINAFIEKLPVLFSVPGWTVGQVTYSSGNLSAPALAYGATTSIQSLIDWGSKNNVGVVVGQTGITVSTGVTLTKRHEPKKIYKLKDIIVRVTDAIAQIYPGNNVDVSPSTNLGSFSRASMTISFAGASPATLALIADQFRDPLGVPFVLQSITAYANGGNLSGTIKLDFYGS